MSKTISKLIYTGALGLAICGIGCGKKDSPKRLWEIEKGPTGTQYVVFRDQVKSELAYYGVPKKLRNIGFQILPGPVDTQNLNLIFGWTYDVLISTTVSPNRQNIIDSPPKSDSLAIGLTKFDSLLYYCYLASGEHIRAINIPSTAFLDPIVLMMNPGLLVRVIDTMQGLSPGKEELIIGGMGIITPLHLSPYNGNDVRSILELPNTIEFYKGGRGYETRSPPRDSSNDHVGSYDPKSGSEDILVIPSISPDLQNAIQLYSPILVSEMLKKYGGEPLVVDLFNLFGKYQMDGESATNAIVFIMNNSLEYKKITREACGEKYTRYIPLPYDSSFVLGLGEAIARGADEKIALNVFKQARELIKKSGCKNKDAIYKILGYIGSNLKETDKRAIQKLIGYSNDITFLKWVVPLAKYNRITSKKDLDTLKAYVKSLDSLESKMDGISIEDMAKRTDLLNIIILADSATSVNPHVLKSYVLLGEYKDGRPFADQVLFTSSLISDSTSYFDIVRVIETTRDPIYGGITTEALNDNLVAEYLRDPVLTTSLLYLRVLFGVDSTSRYPLSAFRTVVPALRGECEKTCLIISGDYDHNGALHSDAAVINTLVKRGYGIVITEAKSVNELIEILDRLEKFNITFDVIYINAHGSPKGIALGEASSLTQKDTAAIEKILRQLKYRGIIIFSSCKTGFPGGIAEKMKLMGGDHVSTVFAPTGSLTDVQKIYTDLKNNIVFVEYRIGKIPFWARILGKAISIWENIFPKRQK
ncbi:MAG: hypothetical protein QXL47_02035 [Candidatus Anstonellales archaeon]